MGTGEASGERRAVLAAEAAIANPLLDEVSMKGARGLLISITGGNDLTLYEVDEAASRIRQEVDEEANIILGATFDQSLDGVVRVSVVATGIDQDTVEIHEPTASQLRIIEAQQRLRAQATARSQPAPAPIHIETAPAPAPVQAAILAAPDEVEIRPAAPKAIVYAEPPAPRIEEPVVREFIPPAPELPVVRAARMPQIEDLPPVVQQQIRAQRGEQPAPVVQGETRRRSLLEKLAAFGISRQEEPAPAPAPMARPMAPMPPAPAPQRPSPPTVHAEYGRPQPRVAAPRPVQGSLDPHGRMGARPIAHEEDQLEIPAFLRRQSS
jgi:cell division protein FtsZ